MNTSFHAGQLRPRAGQAILEFLLIASLIIASVVVAIQPLSRNLLALFRGPTAQIEVAGTRLADLTPEQGEPTRAPEEEGDEEDGRITIVTGPQPQLPPGSTGPAGGIGDGGGLGGGGSTATGGGTGSGSGGAAGTGTASGGGSAVSGGAEGGGAIAIQVPPVTTEVAPGVLASTLTAAERALVNAARNLLSISDVTFRLFDFSLGEVATHAAAQVVNAVGLFGVPVLVADLLEKFGAAAAVFASSQPDGTFDRAKPVYLVFDRTVLAAFTKEAVAAILTHEAWHVTQFFTGIHDDFLHYPRVVDIEYEAFVAGAAVWDTVKGGQSNSALNNGSACVAQGEARCKELLATDFGYGTGLRRG